MNEMWLFPQMDPKWILTSKDSSKILQLQLEDEVLRMSESPIIKQDNLHQD